MDRTQVIIALAVLLFGAFVLGFLTHWIVTRLSRVSHRDLDELDNMAADLHDAELARDTALADRHHLEQEAKRYTEHLEAELKTATTSLREARAEAEELRDFISEQNMGEK